VHLKLQREEQTTASGLTALDLATGFGLLVLHQDLLRPLQQRPQLLCLGHDGGGVVRQVLLPAGEGLRHGRQGGWVTCEATSGVSVSVVLCREKAMSKWKDRSSLLSWNHTSGCRAFCRLCMGWLRI